LHFDNTFERRPARGATKNLLRSSRCLPRLLIFAAQHIKKSELWGSREEQKLRSDFVLFACK